MLSLRLWRALNHPPLGSPLFKRAYAQQGPGAPLPALRLPLFSLFRNVGLIILPVVLILLGAPILALLYYLSLLLAPLLLPLANTLYGLRHAYSVSAGIARERELQTYDVLCASPTGSLGLHWSYCTGWLYYHFLYRYLMLGLLATGIVASVFGLSPQLVFGAGQPLLGVTLTRASALGGLFVLDYLQTPVLSSLTALIVPAYAENEDAARLWAASLFLLLQLAVYVPTLLLGGYALPNTLRLLALDPVLADVLVPLLLLAFFALLREAIIVGLWRQVERHLSATSLELDAITRQAV